MTTILKRQEKGQIYEMGGNNCPDELFITYLTVYIWIKMLFGNDPGKVSVQPTIYGIVMFLLGRNISGCMAKLSLKYQLLKP